MAIRSLHIIKNHPDYYNKTTNSLILSIPLIIIKRLILIFLSTFKSSSRLKDIDLQHSKVIFLSHLINKNHAYSSYDFYYGALKKILDKKKISNFKILFNHVNYNSSSNKKKFLNKNFLILDKILDFKSEFKIINDQFNEFFRLSKKYLYCNNNYRKKIIKEAMLSVFEEQTTFALRASHQLKTIIEKVNPKILISTYEGYPWERLCFYIAKKHLNKIICIAYQNSPIIKSNYAMKRNLKKNYNPDYIWCSNKNSYNELIHSKKLNKKIIKNFGSPKNFNLKKIKKIFFLKTCLVIPEGTYSECIKLFNFSLLCALKNQSLKFIWRVHPIIKIEKILSLLNISKKKLPNNIYISKNIDINKDIIKSDFVLYRGSSAVIQCVSQGCIPIYFDIHKNINIDPIYKYYKKKNYISQIQEFEKLCKFDFLNKKEIINFNKNIRINFFKKLEINKLIKFLNKFK